MGSQYLFNSDPFGVDVPDSIGPAPSYGQLVAQAIAALPRSGDFQPAVGPSDTGVLPWEPSDPATLFALLGPIGGARLPLSAPSNSVNLWNAAFGSSSDDLDRSEPAGTPFAAADFSSDAGAGEMPSPQVSALSGDIPTLPKGAFEYPLQWSDGTGTYEWDASQVSIDPQGRQSATGKFGGRGVITTTNPHGIASSDYANSQTGLFERTFYDDKTHEQLGAFPVVPGQTVRLNDGRTIVTYGLPQQPSPSDGSGFQPSDTIKTRTDLAAAQQRFAEQAQAIDPLGQFYRGLDRWAHGMQLPRVIDYVPLTTEHELYGAEAEAIQTYVPEARGTRPGTADDVINAALSVAAPLAEFAGAGRAAEPTLEGLEAILGRTRGPLLPAEGLPPSQAQLRGIPRFNPSIPSHVVGADAEERLANIVQSMPDEQVVRWGDPIGSHGADVISVNKRTGEVTLWDAKYRGSGVRIQHSPTFKVLDDGESSPARADAIKQALKTIKADTLLPAAIPRTSTGQPQQSVN